MAVATLLLAGCIGELRRPEFAPPETGTARVVGYDETIRAFADSDIATLERLASDFLPPRRGGGSPQFLALSGGGARGAFGAGLLVGWTESGTRPSFDLVTGISAGALIAPFAFLGPEGDADLRDVWTSGVVEGIDDRRFILNG
ncbi:MAG: patatin-like phospholipase family protein, partial [Pseudomonadota bacterium]